ncbi:hypothetical protein EXE30_14835 [Acinetobacter halotolerans]|uniref:Lipoprotein n=1 Tax=Acinetobacter halotolerans TaxID=1752076 RepID=A0A4Q6XG18_9GAMM|nr:hypothetical protein [Acinetobacter halotolerans]RZF49594.1 hypothetical protein EXE30_14835 [Acinetobacter halotolerans]
MKKLALISMVVTGVAFTAVGCTSQGGLEASGSAQTSASPTGAQAGVGIQADTSMGVESGSPSADVSGAVDAEASVQ